MSFTRLVEGGCFYGYSSTTKLSNNQTATMIFYRHKFTRGSMFYVAFAIANKRKQIKQWLDGSSNLYNQSTGKCGLEGLLWAKSQLLEFEEFIRDRKEKCSIVICWTDNRRRDIYRHYLTRIGYKMEFRYGGKCLVKAVIP